MSKLYPLTVFLESPRPEAGLGGAALLRRHSAGPPAGEEGRADGALQRGLLFNTNKCLIRNAYYCN